MKEQQVADKTVFRIPVSAGKVKKHQVTAMHLIAGLLLTVMGIVAFLTPYAIGTIQSADPGRPASRLSFINFLGLGYALFGILLIIITTAFNKRIIQSRANFTLRAAEIAAFATILVYALLRKWYLPAAYSAAALIGIVLAYFLEKGGSAPRFILMDDSGIRIPGRVRTIPWQDIKAVIFRHNVITIDCKDNRLFQITFNKDVIHSDIPAIAAYADKNIKDKAALYREDW